jgi:cysteine desulfurase
MKSKIYLDNNANTCIDPRVLEATLDDLKDSLGNPSSMHSFGQQTRGRLAKARETIASFFNVQPQEIIFTSGGTEGINMVIRGVFGPKFSGHIITSDQEHSCVYSTVKALESQGCRATFLSPGLWGAAKEEEVRKALASDTRLIVLMAVNNETGVKTDIANIAALAQQAGVPFLVDGVSWLGKELFPIPSGVSAMCFSGHKFHAPKGIGFAFIRNNFKLSPIMTGGEQEYGRRGGTENASGIVGLATAVELLKIELPVASQRMEFLRNKLEKALTSHLPNVFINGQGPRVVNTSNVSFKGVDGESLLRALDMEGVAASHGSACASGALEPSRILLQMGLPSELARSSIRFSLSRFTTEQEVDAASDIIIQTVQRLRKIASK